MGCYNDYMAESRADYTTRVAHAKDVLFMWDFSDLLGIKLQLPGAQPVSESDIEPYKRWLIAKIEASKDENLIVSSPPDYVDNTLHAHIVCSRNWRAFWEAIGGTFSHYPFPINKGADYSPVEKVVSETFGITELIASALVDAHLLGISDLAIPPNTPHPPQAATSLVSAMLTHLGKKAQGKDTNTYDMSYRSVRRYLASPTGAFAGRPLQAQETFSRLTRILRNVKAHQTPLAVHGISKQSLESTWQTMMLFTEFYDQWCQYELGEFLHYSEDLFM